MAKDIRYALRTAAALGALCVLLLGIFFLAQRKKLVMMSPPSPASVETAFVSASTVSSTQFISVQPFLFDVPSFWQTDVSPETCSGRHPQNVILLPHYVPAYTHLQRFLVLWKACMDSSTITRVIVIGPDHYHRLSTGSATLSATGYTTPLGTVFLDENIRSLLVAAGATSTEALFTQEHGVGTFPLFIKQAFPEASVTPLVISAQATQAQLRQIADSLQPLLQDPETLVIITADFSHYLPINQATHNDQETRRAFAARDLEFFWSARDTHTDFGRGIWLGWQLAGGKSPFSFHEVFNSVDFWGSSENTTSFFLGWWSNGSL